MDQAIIEAPRRLTIRIPQLDLKGRHFWDILHREGSTVPFLFLYNPDPDVATLLCGKKNPLFTADMGEGTRVAITKDTIWNGAFTFSCPVRFHKQGTPRIVTSF